MHLRCRSEAEALAALLGRAFEAEGWDAAGTERELFCDETVGATLVVGAEGRPVATASLQVRPDIPDSSSCADRSIGGDPVAPGRQ